MPLLIHATGWWLAGLFVGATLSDSAWLRLRGAWVVAAPNWPPPLVLRLVIVLAAGEAAIALAISLNFYNNHATVDVDRADELQG